MGENLVSRWSKFQNFLQEKNKKMEFTKEKNIGFKEYNNAKEFMKKVTGEDLDPLNIKDIISFNKRLYQKIFNMDPGKDPNKATNIRDFIVNPDGRFIKAAKQKLKNIFDKYFEEEKGYEEELKKIISNIYDEQIKNLFSNQDNMKKIKKGINQKKGEIWQKLKKGEFSEMLKNNQENQNKNLKISDDKEKFKIEVKDEQINYSFSYELSKTGISNCSNSFKNELLELKKTRYSDIINKIIGDERFLQIIKYAVESYNIALYTNPKAFFGFWGEIWNTYFVDKVIGDKEHKAQLSAFEQEEEYKFQAPADVYINIGSDENQKIYRFQTKEWKKETFLGKRGFQLGHGKIDYIEWSKNLQYYYTEDEKKELINNIFKVQDQEKISKYNKSIDRIVEELGAEKGKKSELGNGRELFKHLAFGSFNIATNVNIKDELEGNDFFWLNGKFIPSVFILQTFLDNLKDQSNNTKIFIEEKVSENKKDNVSKNYLSVQLSGMQLDFRKKAGNLFKI